MSLILLDDPNQVMPLMRHLQQIQRITHTDNELLLHKGSSSKMLSWASRMFNPWIMRGIPTGCTGAVLLSDLNSICFHEEAFYLDFSRIDKCTIIEVENVSGGPDPDPSQTFPSVSPDSTLGYYPITTYKTLTGETLYMIERFDLHQHSTPIM